MFSVSQSVRILAIAVCIVSTTNGNVFAQSGSGFASSVEVDNVPLVLNGSGTRFKAVFKVYDMAMYTSRKVSAAPEAIALAGPKRLQFTALRELPSTDLGLLFIRGMKDNSSPDVVRKHTAAMSRLIEIFSARKKLLPGDTFSMDFVPGKGTSFYIDGKVQGAPVGDADFFAMVLKIWLGQTPADHLLKDALLGQVKTTTSY
jgi:predicted ATP-grasp superfamily ATP-dependent carboligase